MCVYAVVCCLCSWWPTWTWCIKWDRLVAVHWCRWQLGLAPRSSLVPNSTAEHNGDATVELFVAHMATSGTNHDETDTRVWLPANARKASWHKAGKGRLSGSWLQRSSMDRTYGQQQIQRTQTCVKKTQPLAQTQSCRPRVCSACVLTAWQHMGGGPETPLLHKENNTTMNEQWWCKSHAFRCSH